MSNLRTERFDDPSYLAHVGEGETVPAVGWAITFNGAVFFDSVHVGRSGKYVFNRMSGTPYAQISYEALD